MGEKRMKSITELEKSTASLLTIGLAGFLISFFAGTFGVLLALMIGIAVPTLAKRVQKELEIEPLKFNSKHDKLLQENKELKDYIVMLELREQR
jgi:hypothetical protein